MRSSKLRNVKQRAGWWLAFLVLPLLVLLAAAHLPAAEYAVFKTGFRLAIERHERSGAVTRLFLAGGGVVEVPSGDIQRFEADEFVPQVASPAPAGSGQPGEGDLRQLVRSAGKAHGLDPDLIESVIRVESAGNPRAVSPKGASGLMQLMPETARALRVQDVFDPAQNVEAGTRYLRQLLDLYNHDLALALAAYNAGPAKVAAHKGIPPYRETRNYVSHVIRAFNQKKVADPARQ